MDCQKAQSLVTKFIADEMEGTELAEFVEHIRTCKKCREDLSVYHAIYTIVDQLDNDKELTENNYEAELEAQIVQSEKELQWEKRARGLRWAVFIALLIITAILIEH